MRPPRCAVAVLFVVAAVAPFRAEENKPADDGFMPMFNGKDLTGWVNANCAPSTFFVKDGMIVTTGKPTGFLRTEKQYENFIAEFDWMHIPSKPGDVGNSGFFVWADPLPAVGTGYTRGIEVQVLVNLTYKDKKTGAVTATSQGDLFSIWGAKCVPDRPHPLGWARCLPSEDHCKGEGEWNHYKVVANDGVIKLHVNGHEVSGVSKCNPRKGYLALESEGSECRFRNLKIKELPSTNPKPEECAEVAQGHRPLFNGIDLTGWKADDEAKKHWQPDDWMLRYDGKGKVLQTEKAFEDGEFVTDLRFPPNAKETATCSFSFNGANVETTIVIEANGRYGFMSCNPGAGTGSVQRSTKPSDGFNPPGKWNRIQITTAGKILNIAINGKTVVTDAAMADQLGPRTVALKSGPMDFGNIFVRELAK